MSIVSQARNALGKARGYGGCYRCGDSWAWKQHHDTPIRNGRTCFPLCQECWDSIGVTERLSYHWQLLETWIRENPDGVAEYRKDWQAITASVKAGL